MSIWEQGVPIPLTRGFYIIWPFGRPWSIGLEVSVPKTVEVRTSDLSVALVIHGNLLLPCSLPHLTYWGLLWFCVLFFSNPCLVGYSRYGACTFFYTCPSAILLGKHFSILQWLWLCRNARMNSHSHVTSGCIIKRELPSGHSTDNKNFKHSTARNWGKPMLRLFVQEGCFKMVQCYMLPNSLLFPLVWVVP